MFKKFLNFLIVLQIIILTAIGGLTYYLYKIRVVEQVNTKDIRIDITDNSITKIQAESLTLDSFIKKQENPNFKESFYINSAEEFKTNSINIQPVYKLSNESISKSTNNIEGVIPSFYTDLSSGNLDDAKVINLLKTAIQQDNLKEVDIDVSITNKVNNIETVIKDLLSALTPTDIKINLGLPLKWSDNVDYTYLDSVSRFYKSNASMEVLNNLCSRFRVEGFGYTTIYSANAGPITKTNLAKDTIKYYIYKGINSNKIDLVINNTGYSWKNRSYVEDYLKNYVLNDIQVQIINSPDLNNYLSQDNFEIIENFEDGENLGVLKNDGNIKYIVYPRLTQLVTLVDIAKSYGLNGYIYKNF